MVRQMDNLESEIEVTKLQFCFAENKIQSFAKRHNLPSREEIIEVLGMLDKWSERAMDIMSNLFDLYVQNGILEKKTRNRRRNGNSVRRIFEC